MITSPRIGYVIGWTDIDPGRIQQAIQAGEIADKYEQLVEFQALDAPFSIAAGSTYLYEQGPYHFSLPSAIRRD